ncbi:ribosome small subunit-dependent GTPase A [Paenibacillus allorhizosphaerae]|uniref:Small ribosomal subunit biogenesis GTPase RsgA n=1 Tax=Paenibacillus allorhizosphaerae TaxID=2849866 RepID=A0ABM8VB28_9BACL|nr:ribosome small subunit-dependent GTPase A [Paenibacillus allorhizosphaerae]CAG7617438.1 Small ribosomal subunit biogenesis GTPase RsgA [Paenibacillus allorhizosphaerae]
MDLTRLGWNTELHEQFGVYAAQGYGCGRIAIEHKGLYQIWTADGERTGEISGKMRHQSTSRDQYPAVGDWVVIQDRGGEHKATIHAILPRKSKFSRRAAGNKTAEQIVAANVDTVFLVNALNNDFNLRRIERYLTLTWESGANPVIVLSKADLCADADKKAASVRSIAPGVPVHVISSIQKEGLPSLSGYLAQGQTVALLGSSGAGKSTLINCLAGADIQKVNDVRQGDDRGKHTTTHRELIMLPDGALIMDTPGMRELQLWESSDGLANAFEDIDTLAKACYFNDCSHRHEPGCAVRLALKNGTLEAKRFRSYQSLGAELKHLSRKMEKTIRSVEKEKGKKYAKQMLEKEKGKRHAAFRDEYRKGR